MKKFLAMLLAAVMVLSLVACGGNDNAGNTGDSGDASGDTIKIALIANTTGDNAEYGISVRNGAMLYIDQLNAQLLADFPQEQRALFLDLLRQVGQVALPEE